MRPRRPPQAPKGPPRAGALVARLTRAAFKKRGFNDTAILSHWKEIAGPELAGFTCPEKLVVERRKPGRDGAPPVPAGATLTLRVAGPLAVEVRHMEPQLLERINRYYGHRFVTRLKILQGPMPPARPAARRGKPSQAAQARASAAVRPVADQSLKTALERLGRHVLDKP